MKWNSKALVCAILSSAAIALPQMASAGQASQITDKATSSYAKTKYPLVFAHGMGGWIRAGTDELGVDYWYQILPDLARNGANIWATRVTPFNNRRQVHQILHESIRPYHVQIPRDI